MSTLTRGGLWFSLLTQGHKENPGFISTIKVSDAPLGKDSARFITIVANPENPFPRVRQGEAGLQEGWNIAKAVYEIIDKDSAKTEKSPIVAIVDVKSQAYGRTEEMYGINQALAASAGAYAKARQLGHPVIGIIVGKGMSGGFLGHGYQSNRLIAFDDPEVLVHAMGKEAAARITLRSVEELEKSAETVPPMAYDIKNYNKLGMLWKLLTLDNASAPSEKDQALVRQTLEAAVQDVKQSQDTSLKSRYQAPLRKASLQVREMIAQQWN